MRGKHPMSNEEGAEELRQQIEQATKKAQKLIEYGCLIQEQGTTILDWADVNRNLISQTPSGYNYSNQLDNYTRLNRHLDEQLSSLSSMGTAFYTGTIVTGTLHLLDQTSQFYVAQPQQPPAYATYQVVNMVDLLTHRDSFRTQTIAEMNRLGFSERTDGKDAIKQFQGAWDTHLRGPSTPTSSLIPMRSAIDSTVSTLIGLRSNQRKVRDDKIIEILNQLAFSQFSFEDFSSLQREFNNLKNELAGAKKPNIEREQQHQLMTRATLFLQRLLAAIDHNKLRVARE